MPERVVGIGSSAGGLEALSEMLRSLPLGLPVAYVVAQHMSPTHDSPLVEMLARETGLSVHVARDGAELVTGSIVVAPPNADICVNGTVLVLSSPGEEVGPKPNVDVLLRSIARSWGENAVGIVLSGTGHDGSEGLRAIRTAGGLTIAQRLDTARFEGMPSSAVLTGAVDLVLAPGEIGETLQRLFSPGSVPVAVVPAGSGEEEFVKAILLAVRAATGADFTDYKRSTLLRQIARRMVLKEVDGLAGYHELIAADPDEARALTRLMLVTVTAFFRDSSMWMSLKPSLDELVAGLAADEQVRVWVPGCATGEEAYTVAMLLAAALGSPADLPRRLKVFATDLNEESLAIARRARYSNDAVSAVPPELRARWMTQVQGGDWEIAPMLRDATVFARHNIALDPPFPRLDLISMRNVLIYFRAALQERVLRLCHFALVPQGLLVLGESERIPDTNRLFDAVHAKGKIYRRGAVATPYQLPTPQSRTPFPEAAHIRVGGHERDERAGLRDALIRRFAPPSLITDAQDDVIEVIGDVAPWCWVADGRHSSHVVALLRDELKPVVRTLLVQLRHGGVDVAERSVTSAGVRVSVTRLGRDASGPAVISFTPLIPQDGEEPVRATSSVAPDTADVELVSRELESTREALQSTIEELGASNEELQVMNEELQASTEELQVSGEEVQASNEELEATNEELRTLNQQLQVHASELAIANTNLQNIEDSLTSGLILVDRELRVTRFTPLAVRLFALIGHDLGRPLISIPSTIPVPTLERDLRAAVTGEVVGLQEVTSDDLDFLLQIQPYRGPDSNVRGAVIVITDVAELAAARREIARRLRDFSTVTETVREMVWQRIGGKLQFINSRVEELFGLSRDRVLADPGLLLAAVHLQDRERVAEAAATRGQWEVEYRILRPDGTMRWIRESASHVPAAGRDLDYTVGSALDVTEQHELAAAAESRTAILQAVLENRVFGVVFLNDRGEITQANTVFEQITGYSGPSLIGMALTALVRMDAEAEAAARIDDQDEPAPPPGMQLGRLTARDGSMRIVTLQAHLLGDGPGATEAEMVIVQDITGQQVAGDELLTQARFDTQTGLAGRAYFRARVNAELGRADRAGQSVAVLWIDLDGFKEVNDHYGHRAGDEVLRELAARLQKSARRQDLVGRLGGDEFAILMTEPASGDRLEIAADRILAVLREPVTLSQSTVHLSGSMGIAVSPFDGTDADSLLHNADTAMYAAKQLGRDRRVYFRTDMNMAAEKRAELRHQLSAAARSQDFTMHYQPIVDSTTGEIQMAEALLRWNRDGEVVPAVDFIDLAEQTGQMRLIGRMVLDLVDQDLRVMSHRNGARLPIAVNLSPTQLEDRETTDWLLSWNPPGGLGRIVFEITESVDLTQNGRSLEMLTLLQRLGAKISIDDFGTGYSNFRFLDKLRPDFIKIDRSLLDGASKDPHALEVFAAALQIAHAMADAVVVEGIETEEEEVLVGRLEVPLSQGFRIAHPMPLADFERWGI